MLNRRPVLPGTRDSGNAKIRRHRPVWLGEMTPAALRKFLRDAAGDANARWAVFVEEPASAQGDGAGKFSRAAVYVAARLAAQTSLPAPVRAVHADGGRIALRAGLPFDLPTTAAQGRRAARLIARAFETCIANPEDNNIALAFARWGSLHGWSRPLFLDPPGGRRMTFRQTFRAAWALGAVLAARHRGESAIGIMLPSSAGTAAVFYAATFTGLAAVILNPAAGRSRLASACRTAQVSTIYTSQKLLDALPAARDAAEALKEDGISTTTLESLRPQIGTRIKIGAALASLFPARAALRLQGAAKRPADVAAILFTSGSESDPKGVALSHGNLLSNTSQTLARLDDIAGEKMLNALPVFHAFGLLAGVVLPAAAGVCAMQYPSPLHYRRIPEIVHDFRPSIFFSADSFLASYAREAHPLDMASLRLIFAGAEKLKESTRRIWAEKFGVRVLEGYGVTETSPVVSFNSPAENRPGTVGVAVSGMQLRIEPEPGVPEGGRLWASGPNIMRGYLHPDRPGEISPPPDGWHDTGDIATIDADGFIRIMGRARRFIKIAGEMVPLDGVEQALHTARPSARFAVVGIVDSRRGEQLAAITDDSSLSREDIAESFHKAGLPQLWIPRRVVHASAIPQLPAGKTDYPAAKRIAEAAGNKPEETE